MVCINRYFYEVFFKDPGFDGLDDRGHPKRLRDMFYASTKFIADYFKACIITGEVTSDDMEAIIDEVFPELVPYVTSFRCMKGIRKPIPLPCVVDFDDLTFHLESLLPTDWVSLIHTAALEEKRRGLSVR